jgi:hypothetical protein
MEYYVSSQDKKIISDMLGESFDALNSRSPTVLATRLLNRYPRISSYYDADTIAAAMNGIIGKHEPSYIFSATAIINSEKLRKSVFNGNFDKLRCLI